LLLPLEPMLKLAVVLGPVLSIDQAGTRVAHLGEKPLGIVAVRAREKSLEVRPTRIGRVADHLRVRFKQGEPQQPVVMGGLLFGGDTEPLLVWIESAFHSGPLRNVRDVKRSTEAAGTTAGSRIPIMARRSAHAKGYPESMPWLPISPVPKGAFLA